MDASNADRGPDVTALSEETLFRRYVRAQVLLHQRDYERAADELELLFSTPDSAVDPDDPHVLGAQRLYAEALLRTRRPGAALVKAAEAVEAHERTMGLQHPETLTCHRLCIEALARAGPAEDALLGIEALLTIETRVHGAHHTRTLLARRVRLEILLRLDRRADARTEAESLLRDAASVLGLRHPDVQIIQRLRQLATRSS